MTDISILDSATYFQRILKYVDNLYLNDDECYNTTTSASQIIV